MVLSAVLEEVRVYQRLSFLQTTFISQQYWRAFFKGVQLSSSVSNNVDWKTANSPLSWWLFLAYVALLISADAWNTFILPVNPPLLLYLLFGLGGSSLRARVHFHLGSWTVSQISPLLPSIIFWPSICRLTAHPHGRSAAQCSQAQHNSNVRIQSLQPSSASGWERAEPAFWIARPLLGSTVVLFDRDICVLLIYLWQSRILKPLKAVHSPVT